MDVVLFLYCGGYRSWVVLTSLIQWKKLLPPFIIAANCRSPPRKIGRISWNKKFITLCGYVYDIHNSLRIHKLLLSISNHYYSLKNHEKDRGAKHLRSWCVFFAQLDTQLDTYCREHGLSMKEHTIFGNYFQSSTSLVISIYVHEIISRFILLSDASCCHAFVVQCWIATEWIDADDTSTQIAKVAFNWLSRRFLFQFLCVIMLIKIFLIDFSSLRFQSSKWWPDIYEVGPGRADINLPLMNQTLQSQIAYPPKLMCIKHISKNFTKWLAWSQQPRHVVIPRSVSESDC